MKKIKIGLDLDDVIADLVTPFVSFVNEKLGTSFGVEDIVVYDLHEIFKISPEYVQDLFDEFNKEKLFTEVKILEGFAEAFALMRDKEVFIITGRPLRTVELTKKQLHGLFPNNAFTIIHTSDVHGGDHKTKPEICEEKGVAFMFEDNKDIALKCAQRGVKTFLFAKPWNQDAEDHSNLIKVASWREAIPKLKEMF